MLSQIKSFFQPKPAELDPLAKFISAALWVFPLIVPFLIIIFKYLLQGWYWGLMDDSLILQQGPGMYSIISAFFRSMFHFGQFRPMLALHVGIFYSLFDHEPNILYILKAIEIGIILIIWGAGTYRLTKSLLSVFLLGAVTLSFHYFYDAFFYISSHEMIGMLFGGIAFHFFISHLECVLGKDFDRMPNGGKSFGIPFFILGIVFLLCAFGSKEPFVSVGIAFGMSYLFLAWANRKNDQWVRLLIFGGILIIVTLLYGGFLLTSVKSAYTGGYSLFNGPKIVSGLRSWLKKDLSNHAPWIFGPSILFCLVVGIKKIGSHIRQISLKKKWGIVLGILLYVGYVWVLLPWNTISYYATPLGLFFAVVICLLMSDYLKKINVHAQILIVVGALMFNMLVCLYALERESMYQYDTQNFMEWVHKNPEFHDNPELVVLCNGMEASAAIPWHINYEWGLNLKGFHWAVNYPDFKVQGKKAGYLLLSPRFNSIDLSGMGDSEIVFWSRNWRMHRIIN